MNLPEPILHFMTSSRRSCLSILQQVINIKMIFFACVIKSFQYQLFSQMFSPVISECLFINLLSKAILYWIQSYQKGFSLSFVVLSPALPLSWQKVRGYHFIFDCGCISINQKTKSKLKDMSWPCRAPNRRNICNDYTVPNSDKEACMHAYMNVLIFHFPRNASIAKYF